MAKLYGLANYIISDVAMKLMLDEHFYKFVYYKDIDENGEDILSQPDLESPIETLTQKGQGRQVFLNRRPEKVIHKTDVNIFIYFDDQFSRRDGSKKIKKVKFKVSVLVHNECKKSPNGSRDICIISAIEKVLDGTKLSNGIGNCSVDGVVPMYGLNLEHIGYEVICSAEGFRNDGLPVPIEFEVEKCL